MRLCTQCTPNSDTWSQQTAPPGRCSECGRAFDVQGAPIEDESLTCPVHEPILASCPHGSADADEVPAPAASWIAVDTPTTTAGAHGAPGVAPRGR